MAYIEFIEQENNEELLLLHFVLIMVYQKDSVGLVDSVWCWTCFEGGLIIIVVHRDITL